MHCVLVCPLSLKSGVMLLWIRVMVVCSPFSSIIDPFHWRLHRPAHLPIYLALVLHSLHSPAKSIFTQSSHVSRGFPSSLYPHSLQAHPLSNPSSTVPFPFVPRVQPIYLTPHQVPPETIFHTNIFPLLLRYFSNGHTPLGSQDGTLLKGDTAIQQRWKEHFAQLLNRESTVTDVIILSIPQHPKRASLDIPRHP